MSKFKEGDRVRLIGRNTDMDEMGQKIGDVGTIENYGGPYRVVRFDNGILAGCILEDSLQLESEHWEYVINLDENCDKRIIENPNLDGPDTIVGESDAPVCKDSFIVGTTKKIILTVEYGDGHCRVSRECPDLTHYEFMGVILDLYNNYCK